MDADYARSIGARARKIRRRRGVSLEVVAGLAGITASYLSMSSLHFDCARVLAQESGARDADAIRHLDTADHIAPQRIRSDPVARDLVLTLNQRAQRHVWELDSLCNRFGVSKP